MLKMLIKKPTKKIYNFIITFFTLGPYRTYNKTFRNDQYINVVAFLLIKLKTIYSKTKTNLKRQCTKC